MPDDYYTENPGCLSAFMDFVRYSFLFLRALFRMLFLIPYLELFNFCRYVWATPDELISGFYGQMLKDGGVPQPMPPLASDEMRKLYLEHAPKAKQPIQEPDLRELEEIWVETARFTGITTIIVVVSLFLIAAISLWQFAFPWADGILSADSDWGGVAVAALLSAVWALFGWLTLGVAYVAVVGGSHLWGLHHRHQRAVDAIWGEADEAK